MNNLTFCKLCNKVLNNQVDTYVCVRLRMSLFVNFGAQKCKYWNRATTR